mmetsp:Transcript_16074/g.19625  ORF Transcript_16074/g.19625 Transcript_16074/m.19625 type:complete len:605 (+) Transcript_16074:111-1925(+)
MAKKNKNKRKQSDQKNNNGNNKNTPNNKRQKRYSSPHKKTQFWIEKCKETKPPSNNGKTKNNEGNSCDKNVDSGSILKVMISAVQLLDNHTHGGNTNCCISADKNNACEKKNNTRSEKKHNGNSEAVTNQSNIGESVKHLKQDLSSTEEKSTSVKINDVITAKNENNTVSTCRKDEEVGKNDESLIDKEKLVDKNDLESAPKKTSKPFVQIIHLPSVKQVETQFKNTRNGRKRYVELPNGDCGDGILNPFPKDEVDDKYWAQRKRFFTKFDEGIKLDKESWYSVTPEAIANHIGKRMAMEVKRHVKFDENGKRGAVVMDAFCGCGGNAIGFATQSSVEDVELILCIDVDRSKLKMAANNASIYGVKTDRIVFIEADATFVLENYYKDGNLIDFVRNGNKTIEKELVGGYKVGGCELLPTSLDAVFLSPPWGGPDYLMKGNRLQDISVEITWKNLDKQEKNLNKTEVIHSSNPLQVEAAIEKGGREETSKMEEHHDNTQVACKNLNDKETKCEKLGTAQSDEENKKRRHQRTSDRSYKNGEDLLMLATTACKRKIVIYFLPKSTDGKQVALSAWKAGYREIEMEKNILNGKLKTVTAYLKNFAMY